MLNEREINDHVLGLAEGYANNDEEQAGSNLIALIGSALVDLNRIAGAVEKMATFELHKVGEIVFAGAKPDVMALTGEGDMVLSAQEVETVLALRQGLAKVMPAKPGY